jgi:hypothetical protein
MLLTENKNEILNDRETVEGNQLIVEAILMENGIELTSSEEVELMQENLLSERNIVKLDKYSRKNRLLTKSAIIIAKEANDPLFKKLAKVYMQKRTLRAAIEKKYATKAAARVRKILAGNNVLKQKDIAIDRTTKPKDQ